MVKARAQGKGEAGCLSTSLFSRQWTMKRKVPCWELRIMNRTWKNRLVWYRPRIQVQPSMKNWATILNKINLKQRRIERAIGLWNSVKVFDMVSYLVSLDWETSLFMLAKVGLRLHRVAQNKIQLSLEKKRRATLRWDSLLISKDSINKNIS